MDPLHLRLALDALPGNVSEKAAKLGVHRTTLHRWCSGESAPREEQLAVLASLVGVPAAAIRYGPTPYLRSLLPPRKWTREEVATLPVAEAAEKAGVSVKTIRRWRAKW